MTDERATAPASLPPATALAFLGDGVYSLLVRERLVRQGLGGLGKLHEAAQAYVTCEAQALAWERVKPCLGEDEGDVCRRAYNSTHLNAPKHATGRQYRAATALEALFGYLEWAGRRERMRELFALCCADETGQG